MQLEMVTLRQEVQSLRREVRGQRRKQRRSLMVAVIAIVIAAVSPVAAFAANPFNDLVGGSPHNGNIDLIYNAGITTGCVPNQSYCPTDLVTRQEMASFLARTAGLGGNQPVANARTAVQATTAQTALNANLINGFAANDLLRTNLGGSGQNLIALDSSIRIVASTAINIPGPGFVILHGSLSVVAGASSGQFSEVGASLVDNTANTQGYAQFAFLGDIAGTSAELTMSPSWIFQVTAGGPRTFYLVASRSPQWVGSASAFNGVISAVYVPFGPGGAVAAEADNAPNGFPWSPGRQP